MKYKYPFVILIVLLFSCENNENRKKAVSLNFDLKFSDRPFYF